MEGVLLILIVLCLIVIVVLLLGKFQKNEPVADMIYFNKTIDMLRNQIASWKKDYSSLYDELQKIKKENLLLANLNVRQVELIKQLESEVESKEKAICKQSVDDYSKIINAKNPFDYVAHLRAHALEHIKEYEGKKVDELAELFKYQYKFEYLLSIYPELRKFKDDDAYIKYKEEEDERCSVKNWLSEEEYKELSEVEREQLAVDRYIKQEYYQWSDWEKGRNYEIYCAYKLFNEGYDIIQEGLNKKLEDGGRDIIATHHKTGKILIVQCKNWGDHSQIRENLVFQLYGSFVQWKIDNEDKIRGVEVEPWLYITCDLSPEAIKCANLLGVNVRRLPMDRFPPIKCNVNHNTGQKIYHLPFDRHYDQVKINAKGKGYKFSIAEAIKEGFRRAYNH